jgi:hypothetical protein
MKKLILIALLACGFGRLNAQQFTPVKPADSLLNSLNKKLNQNPGNSLQFLQPPANYNPKLSMLITNNTANIDHMPVVVLEGNSKMPVKKLGGYYTMPVKKIGSEDQSPVNRNFLPGLPTLKTP